MLRQHVVIFGSHIEACKSAVQSGVMWLVQPFPLQKPHRCPREAYLRELTWLLNVISRVCVIGYVTNVCLINIV